MKPLSRILLIALACIASDASAENVATTAGNNLTAFNATASNSNNNWNNMMNNRSGGTAAPTADFGNCNSVILRCAQPKCSGGGCGDINVAAGIVAGCVNASSQCKKYGNDLVQYISAQLVANSNAAKQQAEAAAAAAAAEQSAAQMQQMQQMQQQMQQMQQQMAQQSEDSAAQLQAALAEQRELMAQQQAAATAAAEQAAAAKAAAASSVTELSDEQRAAAAGGMSADVLLREQMPVQIMSKIENSETSVKSMKAAMETLFDYAKCDRTGNNCEGPKRIKIFKTKARDFFTPYDTAVDEMYDALIMAQTVGVDLTDIYMMLNDSSCNAWGRYLCKGKAPVRFTTYNCEIATNKTNGNDNLVVSQPCKIGDIVPTNIGGCQLLGVVADKETVQREWVNGDDDIQVSCMSDSLGSIPLFAKHNKKKTLIDIETLERMVNQDGPKTFNYSKNQNATADAVRYCWDGVAVDTIEASSLITELQQRASTKTLPKDICGKWTGASGSYKFDKGNDCDDDNDVINPKFALCETHVFNVGATTNPNNTEDREQMRQVIGLKSTIIVQQVKKQYDYLNATLRRFKILLEKASLTAKLEAAGATESKSSSGSASLNANGAYISGARDCDAADTPIKVVECLRNNYSYISGASGKGKNPTTETKQQLANDYKLGTTVCNKEWNITKCDLCKKDACENHKGMNQKIFEACLSNFNNNVRNCYDELSDKKSRNKYKKEDDD